jgi:1-acyl-sn-glycerol-3-phosphate acyltransferase
VRNGRDADRRPQSHVHDEKAGLLRWLHRHTPQRWGRDPRRLDLALVERTVERVGRLFGAKRYFGLDVQGWEHLPPPPVVLVSNHSGGTIIPDVWGFAIAWYRRFGRARPIRPAAHEMILSNRITGRYFSDRGVVCASPDIVLTALRVCGNDVMVCPGGDVDTWRPYRERFQVRFAGRKGYARLALRAGVPVVPVANAGPHETLIVLTDGRRIARLMRLHALARADIFPIHLSLPWGLAIGPLPHIPWPKPFRYRIGEPIQPTIQTDHPTEDDVARLDERVRGSMQSLLRQLERESMTSVSRRPGGSA